MICIYMIPKACFMDFGLLYENDKGEYVMLNDVRMADICLAHCVPIAHLRQNNPFPLLYLGHAQIIRKYLSRRSTETLIHAFVSSRVDYCNSLLYGLPAYQLDKLLRVQNAANSELTLRYYC